MFSANSLPDNQIKDLLRYYDTNGCLKKSDNGLKINVFGFEFKSLKTIMPGATMYNPMLSAITDTPHTNNSNSEPLSARVIIESEEIIVVMNNFTASLNAEFCLSQSAIAS